MRALLALLALAGGAPGRTPTVEDYERHVTALRGRLPAASAVAVAPPSVAGGSGGEAAVRRWADRTVGWGVRRLKESFSEAAPDEIIDVWLFKDAASYRRYAKELFDDEPTTPYGYYSPRHRALVMNISTGGGAPATAIVPPLLRPGLPDPPPRPNPGVGSAFAAAAA